MRRTVSSAPGVGSGSVEDRPLTRGGCFRGLAGRGEVEWAQRVLGMVERGGGVATAYLTLMMPVMCTRERGWS